MRVALLVWYLYLPLAFFMSVKNIYHHAWKFNGPSFVRAFFVAVIVAFAIEWLCKPLRRKIATGSDAPRSTADTNFG